MSEQSDNDIQPSEHHGEPMSASMSELLQGLSCESATTRDGPSERRKNTILSRRSIRFPAEEALHRYHEGPDVDILAACRRDIWYQYEELKHIKRKALVLSKEAQRYGLGSVLTNTYGNTSTETQTSLQTWVCNASSRRGLERWINDEYAAKRSDIRKRTIQSVLRAQCKMQESAIADPDYSAKVLSRLSEAFSVDSKEFARSMGIADEKASQMVDNETTESEVDSVSGGGPPPSILKKNKLDPLLLRKAPLRLNSPRTVIPMNRPPASASFRAPPVRNFAMSSSSAAAAAAKPSSSTSADFRHFY